MFIVTVFEIIGALSQIIIQLYGSSQGWLLGLDGILHYVPITCYWRRAIYVPLISVARLQEEEDLLENLVDAMIVKDSSSVVSDPDVEIVEQLKKQAPSCIKQIALSPKLSNDHIPGSKAKPSCVCSFQAA